MERKVIVICSVVGFLGILSAALGFAAEAKRIQGSQVKFTSSSTCMYPSSPALGLGFTAAAALMVAQIIITFTTGCICCRRGPRQSNSHWTLALVCFVVSWFTFVVAFLLLLTGAVLNHQHGEETRNYGNYYCYVVKPGVFAGAAVLSLASVILGIVYYLALNEVKNSNSNRNSSSWGWGWGGMPMPPPNPNPNQGNIAMGRPQFPPPNTQAPVFVHEDTYMRQQFT